MEVGHLTQSLSVVSCAPHPRRDWNSTSTPSDVSKETGKEALAQAMEQEPMWEGGGRGG